MHAEIAASRSFPRQYYDAEAGLNYNTSGTTIRCWGDIWSLTPLARRSYGSLSYLYDADGNRSQQTVNSVLTSYTYGTTNNRLTKVNTTGWSYDADGSLTKDGTFTYSYDDSERLSTVTKSGLAVNYLYNGLGQRAEKTINGTSTVFIYDEAGHLLGEYTPSGTLIAEHIWLNDRPIAVITPTGTYYVHTDQLNTPRYITNASKQLVWEWLSDPFGTSAPNQNPSGLGTFTYNLRFPGQYYDAESGNNYNYFRDYDPSIGRYIESDPVGLVGGFNTFIYGLNNPPRYKDPLGLDVYITIMRGTETGDAIEGSFEAWSDITGQEVDGYTLENLSAAIPNGEYLGFIRTDHSPNRIQLEDVPHRKWIQIHNGNYPYQSKGCILVGKTPGHDEVLSSIAEMQDLLNLIKQDGTGNIYISVTGNTSETSSP